MQFLKDSKNPTFLHYDCYNKDAVGANSDGYSLRAVDCCTFAFPKHYNQLYDGFKSQGIRKYTISHLSKPSGAQYQKEWTTIVSEKDYSSLGGLIERAEQQFK